MRTVPGLRLASALAIALCAAVLVAPVATAAEVFRFTDAFATAGFRTTDPTGCVVTRTLITGGDDFDAEPPGEPTFASGASIRIISTDQCTGETTLGSGSVSEADFHITGAANTATLTAAIPVRFSGPEGTFTEDVFVDLTWTATGEPDRTIRDSHFRFDGFILNAFFHGLSREAVATGTILWDGENLAANGSVSAEITFDVGSQVTITE